MVTFPFKSLAASVKNEGPKVREVGASVGLATVKLTGVSSEGS
jgi:hypothetical protein